jgi:hypothetical protein
MNTVTAGLSRVAIAACASAITAVSTWAFLDGTASMERDPFHFASTMAANAKVRVAQTPSRTASTCPNKSSIPGRLPAPVCLKG